MQIRVFVSSTEKYLKRERKAVEEAIQGMEEMKYVGMEYTGSHSKNKLKVSLDDLRKCQIYLGIIGGCYGEGVTEKEYYEARKLKLDCIIFFKDKDFMLSEEHEADPEKAARLDKLKNEMLSNHTIKTFTNPDELAKLVTRSLHRWLSDNNPSKFHLRLSDYGSMENVNSILVVGSAYAEHTLQLRGDMILGGKQVADINDFYGGSGINYVLRLIENGVTAIPMLNIGKDKSGDAIRSEISKCAEKAEFPSNIIELIKSDDFCVVGSKTLRSYIVIEDTAKRRTIFGEKFGEPDKFYDHIRNQVNKINQLDDLDVNVVVIGHIPEQVSSAPCTEYLIDEFKNKSIIFTNFGDSQIRLHSTFWEDKLTNIDIFQLNLHEIRKFFSDQTEEEGHPMSLIDIINWLKDRNITTVITLDEHGAIATYKDDKERIIMVKPFNIDSYIDPTGSGDAMGAGIVSIH